MSRLKISILENLLDAYGKAFRGKQELGSANLHKEIESTIVSQFGADSSLTVNVYRELEDRRTAGGNKAVRQEQSRPNRPSDGIAYVDSTLSDEDFSASQKKTPGYTGKYAAPKSLAEDTFKNVAKSDAARILSGKTEEEEENEELEKEISKLSGILQTTDDDLLIKHKEYPGFKKYAKDLFEIDLPESEEEGMKLFRQTLYKRLETIAKSDSEASS